MAESSTAATLRSKRDELERIISSYEKATTAARRDLAHVNATLELFERDGVSNAYPSRMSIVRMFKRGEIFELCKIALSASPQCLDTRELSLYVIHAKGMDENDTILRKAIGFRIVKAMLRPTIAGAHRWWGETEGCQDMAVG
jgi:hypothetical protein